MENNNESDQAITNGSADPFLRDGIGSFPERLEQVIGGQSVRQFAHEIGLSEGAVRAFKQGRIPRADDALAIARYSGVDLTWLLSGEGQPPERVGTVHTLGQESVGAVAEQAPRYADQDAAFLEEYALIDGYHISVSAGHGAFNQGQEVKRRLAFRRKWLQFRQLQPEHLAVVFAKGDSMEPTIHSGDTILIDTTKNQIQDGGLFVLRLGDELYAKRVQKRVDGGVNILSDNKAEYETMVVLPREMESLSIIGKVVWVGHDFF